jgi:nitrous oxidase accessory protein NosD
VRNCLIERNGEIGVLFRKEPNEYRTGDRNLLENCVIRDNGKAGPGLGIDIQWKTNDITIRNCIFENTLNGPQRVGVRISPEAQRIALEKNTFKGCPVNVEDQRKGV